MLDQIQNQAYTLISSSRFWMILLAVIFFLLLSGYVYITYVSPMVNKNKEFVNNQEFVSNSENNKEEVVIYMFTVTWCPHSKKAMPVWEELKEKYNGKEFNNYILNFIQIDGEENTELADKYKVEGYPTIK